MTTVQLAIHDSSYAQSLRNLLLRDGAHRVLLVDKPDLKEEGVVVMEANGPENLSLLSSQPERFVVITRKGTDHLTRIWDAGVRHVVFEEDSPNTAQLAVIAAELRIPKPGLSPGARDSNTGGFAGRALHSDNRRLFPRPGLFVLESRLDLPPRRSRCCPVRKDTMLF
jgi:hypothetical protein